MKQLLAYTPLAALTLALAACGGASDAPTAGGVPSGRCDVALDYDIRFERFDETAQQIAHGTGCGIITDTARTGAVRPAEVVGHLTPRQAVVTAIQGTDLRISEQTPDAITVE